MNIGRNRIGGVLKKTNKRKGSDYWIGLEPTTPANAATMHCVSTGRDLMGRVSIGDGDEVIANDSIPVAGLLGLDIIVRSAAAGKGPKAKAQESSRALMIRSRAGSTRTRSFLPPPRSIDLRQAAV